MDFLQNSRSSETYYDVLSLSKDCTSKEIKEAFVKLSKEHHPDKSQNAANSHEKFVKINEAYSVLSRDRKKYDEFLKAGEFDSLHQGDKRSESAYEHWEKNRFRKGSDPRKYSHFYQYYNARQYKYDVPPPNQYHLSPKQLGKLALGISAVVIISFVMNFYVVRKIAEFRDDHSRKRSEINSIMYSYSQGLKKLYGNDLYSKLANNEVRNMTLAEATAEYERRHRKDQQK